MDTGGRGGARVTEERGEAGGMKEPDRAMGRVVPSCRMVDDRPRRSQWDEGAIGAGRLLGHGGEEGAWSHGGANGSMGPGVVRASEAGGGVEGNSDHGDVGGWQSRRAQTA